MVRPMRSLLPLAILACAHAEPPPESPDPTQRSVPDVVVNAHPASCDNIAALLAQHANTFGSPAQINASLPRTFSIEQALGDAKGNALLALDRTTHRYTGSLSGVSESSGIDAEGPWETSAADVRLRLQREEATSVYLVAWIARRNYLTDFNPKRDRVFCEPNNLVRVHYARTDIGEPDLTFDASTRALRFVSSLASDGRRHLTEYNEWAPPDAGGVRWPKRSTSVDPNGNQTLAVYLESAPGLKCAGDCLTPPASKLAFAWPSPTSVVRVPMKHYMGELSFRVTVDGVETWALLDSGAGLTIVDASTPMGKRFAGKLRVAGTGSSQTFQASLGEISRLKIGELELAHLPTASVPIRALDGMGIRRPEAILGFSLFLGSVIHVDYAKGEIAFAQSNTPFVSQKSVRVPMRILDGKPVADVTVGLSTGPFLLDTGNAGGVDMTKLWADAHGFPGARSAVQMRARTGAGASATEATYFRLEQAALGPIQHADRIVQIDNPPDAGVLAGLVGNEVLSRCAAVTFDVQRRNLWLEPPCDRPSPENKSGWRLMRVDDPAFKSTPWIVESIMPGGSAEHAGIVPGDRILSVGGVAANLDIGKVREATERAAGSNIAVVLIRNGKPLQVPMLLTRAP
jgi:hypothetical protein